MSALLEERAQVQEAEPEARVVKSTGRRRTQEATYVGDHPNGTAMDEVAEVVVVADTQGLVIVIKEGREDHVIETTVRAL